MNRRRFLKYAAVGAAVVGSGLGGYEFDRWQNSHAPRQVATTTLAETQTLTQTTTSTTVLSPLAVYAKSAGLPDAVITELGSKLGDSASDNNKALVDYLSSLLKAEVVSSDVLQFAPADYKSSVAELLQMQTVDDVVEESKVPDLTVTGLGYLSTFPGYTQRWYIEQHGLDASAIDLLTRAKGLGNQDFARYAVGSLVCIQDHDPLTTAEVAFLQNPGNNFRAVRDGYLTAMESKGNPYDSFAKDWKKMLQNANLDGEMESLDATEDWVNLVSSADNPEVVEAEELKLAGGTPNPTDFSYSVPDWNTEQQVQYWLGKQNEYKKRDDILAQALSITHGLLVAISADEVAGNGEAVYRDSNSILNFGRETSEIQSALRLPFNLEDYPLEASVAWAYTMGLSTAAGPHSLGKLNDEGKKVTLQDYDWNQISLDTLKLMRKTMIEKKWITSDADNTISNLEGYFFPSSLPPYHWIRTDEPPYAGKTLTVDGEEVPNDGEDMINPNFEFEYFLNNGKGIGVCGDEATLINGLAKSVGIATTAIRYFSDNPNAPPGHEHIIYYNPDGKVFKAYEKQLEIAAGAEYPQRLLVFRPVHPSSMLVLDPILKKLQYNWWFIFDPIPGTKIRDMFLSGYSSAEFKKIFLDFTKIWAAG